MSPDPDAGHPPPHPEHAPGSRPLPEHFRRLADSAGQPWQGRHFGEDDSYKQDDGSAPAELIIAITDFRAGRADAAAVIDALRAARLLIPLVAELGEEGTDEAGRRIDKTQELAIVTVAGPDGRSVLPAFSSVTAMSTWDPAARPVPTSGARVALAAASEHTDLMIIDPGSTTEFAVRRPAAWAMAQERPWRPAHADPAVAAAFEASIAAELAVLGVTLDDGDPTARLAGPELVVQLELMRGLTETELDAVLARLSSRWAADDTIAAGVDSLSVRLVPSAD